MSTERGYRVGRTEPRNVYRNGRPLFVAATEEEAREVVAEGGRGVFAPDDKRPEKFIKWLEERHAAALEDASKCQPGSEYRRFFLGAAFAYENTLALFKRESK